MLELSSLIKRIQPSPTMAATALAQELKAQGRDVISFTVGEPDFDTPEHIKEAATAAMQKGYTKYTAVGGIAPLKSAIIDKLQRDQGLTVKASQVCVTNGGKQALAAACAVTLDPGDEVIIPSPYWTSYPDLVRLTGAIDVVVRTKPENGYLLTPEELLGAATERTRMVILNTPSNPTGAAYSREELVELGRAIRSLKNASRIVILSDEVYEPITFDGFKHTSIVTAVPELAEQTVIVNAFSKAYSMTGWRVGYAVGAPNVINAIMTHQSQFTSNVCSIAQHAAAAAYSDNYAFPHMMAKEFQLRYQMVCDAMSETDGIYLASKPKGAFYAFLRIERLFGKRSGDLVIRSGLDFATLLLEKYDVATVQGEAFGDAAAIRMSFSLDRTGLKRGLDRILEAVRSLQ